LTFLAESTRPQKFG